MIETIELTCPVCDCRIQINNPVDEKYVECPECDTEFYIWFFNETGWELFEIYWDIDKEDDFIYD